MHRHRGRETFAPADGRYHQVQGGVLGMSALFDQIFGRLFAGADLNELGLIIVLVLAEVGAQAALAFVYVLHDHSFRLSASLIAGHVPVQRGRRQKA
jgi:hypothetical protein